MSYIWFVKFFKILLKIVLAFVLAPAFFMLVHLIYISLGNELNFEKWGGSGAPPSLASWALALSFFIVFGFKKIITNLTKFLKPLLNKINKALNSLTKG